MDRAKLPCETRPFLTERRIEDGVPLTFVGVLSAEIESILERRTKIFDRPIPSEEPGLPPPTLGKTEADELAPHYAKAHEVRPFGVSFSGGGIRSATFNLGVLQGLADLDLLKCIDYVSTVSGGGYIGSWLHGVIRNRCDGDPNIATDRLSTDAHPAPFPPKDDPISFLRKYSNYLAPKPGLFSADSWVIGMIWLRNVLLNQLILLPALSVVMLVPLALVFFKEWRVFGDLPILRSVSAIVALDALLVALVLMARNLRVVVESTHLAPGEVLHKTDDEQRAEELGWVVVPALFVAVLMLGTSDPGELNSQTFDLVVLTLMVVLAGLFLVFQWRGGFYDCFITRHGDSPKSRRWAVWHIVWMVSVTTALTTFLMSATWQIGWVSATRMAYAPVVMCLSLVSGGILLTGMMGVDFPDAAREWMARIGTLLVMTCGAWATLFTIAVFVPQWTAYLFGHLAPLAIALVGGWVLTTLGGVKAGRSTRSRDDEANGGRSWMDRLIAVAPTVFLIGYLVFVSVAVQLVLRSMAPLDAPALAEAKVVEDRWAKDSASKIPRYVAVRLEPIARFASQADLLLSRDPERRLVLVLILISGCVFIAAVASRRININEFSLHHFYKNRLVRCYLGAGRRHRKPNPITGFDSADDFPISSLLPDDPKRPYFGPYPIVNTALNLNAGEELAQQERRAASFVFTPKFCGFAPSKSETDEEIATRDPDLDADGYRKTVGYGFPDGPNIGTAMAISGAAANPNAGYHTSGSMAFLLTVFDARLGWWLGNPRRRDASRHAGPLFALKYLFYELLSMTTGRSQFVNLSDGGHFENLGFYELVRRRCRYIIVADGEADGDLTFGSLGGAIRKCRADFGVEIDLDPSPIGLRLQGFSTVHCVVGTILYPETETSRLDPICKGPSEAAVTKARGWLLYIKSSLTGDEPADVLQYHSDHPAFPHESTGDQFFTESQFESYRRLGLHIVRDAFEDVPVRSDGTLLRTFQGLAEKWYPKIPVTPESASRLANQYAELMRMLGSKEEFKDLRAELVPSLATASKFKPIDFRKLSGQERKEALKPVLAGMDPAEKGFMLEVIQLMQNVHTEFRLEHASNRSNPRNAGWMATFRDWASRPALQAVWTNVQDNYNPLFGRFMSHQLLEDNTDVKQRP